MGGLFRKKEYTAPVASGELSPPIEKDNPLDVVVKMPRDIALTMGVVAWAASTLLLVLLAQIKWHIQFWLFDFWIRMSAVLPVYIVAIVPLLIGLAVFGRVFWKLSPRRLLEHFEKRYQKDFNHDGYVGEPPTVQHLHSYSLKWDTGGGWFDLPDDVDHDHFVIMCKKFLIGRTAEDDHPGMVRELTVVRNLFFSHGLGQYKNGQRNQGWILTAPGRAYCRRVIDGDPDD